MNEEIIICSHCKGFGKIEVLVDHHKGDYENKICDVCDGKGRLKKTTAYHFEKLK